MALAVYNTRLRFLGLVSLQQVKGGRVAIYNNAELCHVGSFNWTAAAIVSSSRSTYFAGNADEAKCREFSIFMAALWNRAGHYIFALWFLLLLLLSFFFSSPNLSRRRLDVCYTPNMVWP